MTRRAPGSTLFPYTTLFRSVGYPAMERSRGWRMLGFDVYSWDVKDRSRQPVAGERVVIVPYWFWLLVTAVMPSDRKSTRLNSSHSSISYAVFCLKKKNSNRD